MIIANTNPTGIEYKLSELQTVLESVLCNPIDTRFNWIGTVKIYNKVQKLTQKDKTLPEVYLSKGEYIQPFLDDTISASIGFSVNSETVTNHVPSANIDLIVTVDLVKIYGNTNRAVSKCINQVYNAIQNQVYKLGPIKEGINDVFNKYSGIKDLFPAEMSNWLVFSINFDLLFDYKI
jgi:hypothetical protein